MDPYNSSSFYPNASTQPGPILIPTQQHSTNQYPPNVQIFHDLLLSPDPSETQMPFIPYVAAEEVVKTTRPKAPPKKRVSKSKKLEEEPKKKKSDVEIKKKTNPARRKLDFSNLGKKSLCIHVLSYPCCTEKTPIFEKDRLVADLCPKCISLNTSFKNFCLL